VPKIVFFNRIFLYLYPLSGQTHEIESLCILQTLPRSVPPGKRSAGTPNRLHSPYSPDFTRHRGRAEACRKSAENYILTEENFHSEENFFPSL
jgi:hypothetical protein